MLVYQLTAEDRELLDVAVRRFRRIEVADHRPFLTDPATVVFVALDGNDLVGWAWGLRQRHVAGYSQVQLYELEVVRAARRRGVGRALVTAMLELVVCEGHRKMWLFTDENNAAAKALYESVGGGPSAHDDAAYWWTFDDAERRTGQG
ncbi:GNAT family N-acetyltransferase [Solihabitans fulvus]|nr:GNAT family N-acetyltransferase [Solihabitans fulvus]